MFHFGHDQNRKFDQTIDNIIVNILLSEETHAGQTKKYDAVNSNTRKNRALAKHVTRTSSFSKRTILCASIAFYARKGLISASKI